MILTQDRSFCDPEIFVPTLGVHRVHCLYVYFYCIFDKIRIIVLSCVTASLLEKVMT